MSGLARAVVWTQRIGYNYPEEVFRPAVLATFPTLSRPEVTHCVHEHQRCQAEWLHWVEVRQWVNGWAEHRERA